MPDQRIQFVKTGRACYISHLDLMRTFQRAFLRAGIHIRHTEGFNPHAYVSIPLPPPWAFPASVRFWSSGFRRADMRRCLGGSPGCFRRELRSLDVMTERPYKELCYVNYIITLGMMPALRWGRKTRSRRCRAEAWWCKKSKEGQERADTGGSHPTDSAGGLRGRRDSIALTTILRAQNSGLNRR